MRANVENILMKNVTKHRMKSKAQSLDVIIHHQMDQNILFGIISSIRRKMVKSPSIAYFVVSYSISVESFLKIHNGKQVLNIHHEMQQNVENI